ncbi:hypothetical protein ACFWSF_36680 [Streptomyces sp. NPDC058611]|uniref:hypothetical protein n=1 Tax=unclassified Streptomyces TaxID=2593676 RepID=UPI003663A5EA
MIEIVVALLAAAGAGWLLRRKHLRRVAAGPVPGIPCMARQPAGAGRWRPGRVYAEEGEARWAPVRGEPVPLPDGRAAAVRAPSVKEAMSINPGSRIVTCAYGDGGTIEIAVMALDLRELLEVVPRPGNDPDAEAGTENRN